MNTLSWCKRKSLVRIIRKFQKKKNVYVNSMSIPFLWWIVKFIHPCKCHKIANIGSVVQMYGTWKVKITFQWSVATGNRSLNNSLHIDFITLWNKLENKITETLNGKAISHDIQKITWKFMRQKKCQVDERCIFCCYHDSEYMFDTCTNTCKRNFSDLVIAIITNQQRSIWFRVCNSSGTAE